MPESTIGLGDFPAWIALAVSLIGATRQWFTNKQNRKELAALENKTKSDRLDLQRKLRIEQLSKDIDELCALSLEYWMKPGAEMTSQGLMINLKTKDISSRFWSYQSFLWRDAGSDFSTIKRQITGGSFQSPRRPASAHDSLLIRSFLDSFADMREKLRIECDRIDIN